MKTSAVSVGRTHHPLLCVSDIMTSPSLPRPAIYLFLVVPIYRPRRHNSAFFVPKSVVLRPIRGHIKVSTSIRQDRRRLKNTIHLWPTLWTHLGGRSLICPYPPHGWGENQFQVGDSNSKIYPPLPPSTGNSTTQDTKIRR